MATRRKILVVDADPRAVAAALRRRGWEVQAVRDGSRALHLAVLRPPDVVLVAQDAPIVDARTFVRILRANPRTAAIPVLVTGTVADGERGELEDFLARPFDPDDVPARVEQVMRRPEAGRAVSPDAGLRGDLQEVPLVDLLQMLSANRRSGRLVVDRDGARAEIVLEGGQVTDAVAGTCAGEKALFRLLERRQGRFSFSPQPAAGPGRISRGLEELLLEGARHADEVDRLLPSLPGRDEVLALAAERGARGPRCGAAGRPGA